MRTGALAAVLAAGLLAGCGGSGSKSNGEASKSATQILNDVRHAAQSAHTVHYSGAIVDNGMHIRIDLRLVAGRGGTGSISVGANRFDIVRIGKKAYFKGSAAFYKQVAGVAAAQLLKGKWLESSATSGDLASFTPLTDITSFFSLFRAKGALTKGAESTVDGQKVVAVRSSTGGTLYVATTGTPYPVEAMDPAGASHGALHFDSWNESVQLAAPKGAIDISKLK